MLSCLTYLVVWPLIFGNVLCVVVFLICTVNEHRWEPHPLLLSDADCLPPKRSS